MKDLKIRKVYHNNMLLWNRKKVESRKGDKRDESNTNTINDIR